MTLRITERTIVVASGRQTTADLGPSVAVLNLDSRVYYTLRGPSRRIWELIAQPAPVEEIVQRLLERYAVDEARCRTEVVALLDRLVSEGLAEIVSG